VIAWVTGLGSRAWAAMAAFGAVLAAIGAVWMSGRRSGIDRARAQAAEAEQKARRAGDEAARAAERDGADKRLRDGRF
jgi:hypothetical protein